MLGEQQSMLEDIGKHECKSQNASENERILRKPEMAPRTE